MRQIWGVEHTDFNSGYIEVVEDGIDLPDDEVNGDVVNAVDASGILVDDGSYCRCGIASERGNGLYVGLNASPTARVAARDGENDVIFFAHLPYRVLLVREYTEKAGTREGKEPDREALGDDPTNEEETTYGIDHQEDYPFGRGQGDITCLTALSKGLYEVDNEGRNANQQDKDNSLTEETKYDVLHRIICLVLIAKV